MADPPGERSAPLVEDATAHPSAPPTLVELDDGLRAELAEAPPNADPDRVLVLAHPVADLPSGTEVLDLRHTDDGVVAIHADHTLWLHDASGRRLLDVEVEAPLSVRGPWLAYARGQMPFFEIVRLDLRGGQPSELTEGFAPAWNPALGPDGSVVFVSGRQGEPGLYRVASGAPERLEDRGAFPSSVRAPVFDGTTLAFEDEMGATHRLEVEPR